MVGVGGGARWQAAAKGVYREGGGAPAFQRLLLSGTRAAQRWGMARAEHSAHGSRSEGRMARMSERAAGCEMVKAMGQSCREETRAAEWRRSHGWSPLYDAIAVLSGRRGRQWPS